MNKSYIKYSGLCMLMLALLISGCHKDDSTLSESPVNNIMVTDPEHEEAITIFQGDSLKLKPLLAQSIQKDLDQLEFQWIIYNNSAGGSLASPRETLSDDYELKVLVNEPVFTLGDSYVLRFEVKDKASGVSSYLNYQIQIGNKYVEGWMVLEDKQHIGDLSFVFPDYSTEHGIYNDRNMTPIIGPRKLEITPFGVGDEISATGKRLYILADEGSQEYNYLTMVKKFDYAFEFFSAPAIEDPQVMTWTSQYTYSGVRSPALGIVINNGKLHSNLVGGFPGVKKWGDVALTPQGDKNYNLAPFAVGGETYPAIVYDNTAKRFYHVRGYNPSPVAGTLEAFPSGGSAGVSTVFDMNNVGMTMIFQDSSDVKHEYNAVMRSADNMPYLFRYKTVNTTQSPNITLVKQQMNAPGFLDFDAAAGSTQTPHIYYAKDNQLIKYETSSNSTDAPYNFPAGEHVTAIRYSRSSPNQGGPVLVVATWDGTTGKLYYFDINDVGVLSQPKQTLGGFSKIVDLVYKY